MAAMQNMSAVMKTMLWAGAGPLAGHRWLGWWMEEALRSGARHDEDFPALLMDTTPIVGVDAHGVTSLSHRLLQAIDQKWHQDHRCGVTQWMVACHSLSWWLQDFCPRISLVPVTRLGWNAAHVSFPEVRHWMLLQSPSVAGVSWSPLHRYRHPHCEYSVPTLEEYALVQHWIEAGMGGNGWWSDPIFLKRLKNWKKLGVQGILLGCTDLEGIPSSFVVDGLPCVPLGKLGISEAWKQHYFMTSTISHSLPLFSHSPNQLTRGAWNTKEALVPPNPKEFDMAHSVANG